MPTKAEHLKQAEKNEKLAEDLLKDGVYSDWGITVLFYSALHYVEAALASLNIHSEDHGDRTVNIVRYFRDINTEYGILCNLSLDVRYDPSPISTLDIAEARKNFDAVKKLLRSYWRI